MAVLRIYFTLQIPPYVKKGKEVKVTIERKRVKAEHKDDAGTTTQ